MSEAMPDILRRICDAKGKQIDRLRQRGEAPLRERMSRIGPARGFRDALLAGPQVALIAEVKKASPSAGVIREDFDPVSIARAYERGGARCISVLTEEEFFCGSPAQMSEARGAVSLPVLRKDFILDELQVLESRAWGADCVLLIVAALGGAQLSALLEEARRMGMDALVEVHTRQELETALSAGADLVGINSRDLRTFEVDLGTVRRLAPGLPEGTALVAESGIGSPEDVKLLKSCGVDAVLVGETLMRAEDIARATRRLSDL